MELSRCTTIAMQMVKKPQIRDTNIAFSVEIMPVVNGRHNYRPGGGIELSIGKNKHSDLHDISQCIYCLHMAHIPDVPDVPSQIGVSHGCGLYGKSHILHISHCF